MVGIERI